MVKKVLVFAGSTSSESINKKLATFAAKNLKNTSFEIIDLRDFNLPIYNIDIEKEAIPEDAKRFSSLLDSHDGYILSLAEHNGSYAAAFKNIFDWSSRIEKKVFREKPLLLMSASPGGRGGASVLSAASSTFPHMGAKNITTFSLPNFFDNFKDDAIINPELLSSLISKTDEFENYLNQ